MRAKFNYRAIAEQVTKSPVINQKMQERTQKKFLVAKEVFLNEFLTHPVTQDIAAGFENPGGDIDKAGILDGYGNLFSFFGLRQSEGDPVSPVFETLDNETILVNSGRKGFILDNKPTTRFRWSIRTPRGKLFEETLLPWDSNSSWLYTIERGISGFSNYIRGQFEDIEQSLSKGGLQKKKAWRAGRDVKTPYFNKLLRDFVKFFKSL